MSCYYYNVRLKNMAWTEVYKSEIERPVGQYVLLCPEYGEGSIKWSGRSFPPDVGIIDSEVAAEDWKSVEEKENRRNRTIPGIFCSITEDEFDSNSIPLGTKEIKERRKSEIAAASKKAGPR